VEVLNSAFRMNSLNLAFFLRLIWIGMKMPRYGKWNETWINFMYCEMVLPGNGHYHITGKDGLHVDSGKANTTGVNFVLSLVSKLSGFILLRINICNPNDNHMGITELPSWTERSIEISTCATTVDGEVVSMPCTMFNRVGMVEIRGSTKGKIDALIANGVARGRTGLEESLNTIEGPGGNNNRKTMKRRQICPFGAVAYASNVRAADAIDAEKTKTLMAVAAECLPGVGMIDPGHKKQRGLGGETVNVYSGVSGTPVQQEMICNILCYPGLVCELTALMNLIGVIPFDMSDVCKSYSDLLMHYTKSVFRGMLNDSFLKNASRKEQGYTSRCIVKSMSCRVLQTLTESRNVAEAVKILCLKNHASAISLHEVQSIPYSFLAAGVDLGVFMMAMVAVKQFEDFPVLLPAELVGFLDDLDKPVCIVCICLCTC
jgi:hypothetical protein